jgi:hypothetical protein
VGTAAVKESLTTALDTNNQLAILTPPTGRETAGDYNQNYQASRLSQPVLGCSLQPWSGFLLRLLRVWVRCRSVAGGG